MEIPYRVEHRNVKHPRLEFRNLQLLIVLPCHLKDPSEIMERRKAWIEKKWGQIQEAINNSNGVEGFIIFGEKYVIENKDIPKPVIDPMQRKITLNQESPRHRKQVIDQLKKLLKRKLLEIVNGYAEKTGFKPNKIVIRQQKTKWGSCSSKGIVSLNLKLICLPVEIIKYIVYHELIHLRHRKHNNEFWRELSREYPDYRHIERRIFEQWFVTEKLFQNLIGYNRSSKPLEQ